MFFLWKLPKPGSSQSVKDRKTTIVTQTLASHNLPTNRARELIKPSTDSASLRLEIKTKKFSAWIFGSLCVTSQWEYVWAFLAPLLGPGRQPSANFFRSKFFLDLWLENQSLEPLINMLAHRETKLWLKNPVFAKLWHFQKRWHWPLLFNFGHSWLAARLSYSKLLKTREVFYIRLNKNFQKFFWPFWSMAPWLEDVLRIFLWLYPWIQHADIVAQGFTGSRCRIWVF